RYYGHHHRNTQATGSNSQTALRSGIRNYQQPRKTTATTRVPHEQNGETSSTDSHPGSGTTVREHQHGNQLPHPAGEGNEHPPHHSRHDRPNPPRKRGGRRGRKNHPNGGQGGQPNPGRNQHPGHPPT